jgi:hypothetical protein
MCFIFELDFAGDQVVQRTKQGVLKLVLVRRVCYFGAIFKLDCLLADHA